MIEQPGDTRPFASGVIDLQDLGLPGVQLNDPATGFDGIKERLVVRELQDFAVYRAAYRSQHSIEK